MRRFTNDRTFMIMALILLYLGPVSAFMSGGVGGLVSWFSGTLTMIPGIVIGLSFHEFAHAKVATLCGDNTPLYQGRVTLDPRAHIDPMGLIYLVFIHFGWGRPVVINPSNFRNRRRDSILVGIAGVCMNFLIALFAGIVLGLIYRFSPGFFRSSIGLTTGGVLVDVVIVNVSLMLFNLLPVPPLDGFGIVVDIFRLWGTQFYTFVFANSTPILMLMIVFNVPSMLLSGPMFRIVNFIMGTVAHFPYWYALV
ncbi:MAG: site-2 protease family protein [Firmicutes bacterium]|nr:site-2 protease family protein [Bacillota bacterium]